MNDLENELESIRSRLSTINYEAENPVNIQRLFSEIADYISDHLEDDIETLGQAVERIQELEEANDELLKRIAELEAGDEE